MQIEIVSKCLYTTKNIQNKINKLIKILSFILEKIDYFKMYLHLNIYTPMIKTDHRCI